MLTGNTQFEVELKKRIAEEIGRLKDILAQGDVPQDYAQYKHLVGQIFALERVAGEYCSEVDTLINNR